MKIMQSPMRLLLAVIMICAASASHAAEEGWIELFNGKDLSGWTQRGGKANYKIEGNEIVGATVVGTPNSFLCTEKEYGDFILELEFKVDPKLNSGVQVRSLSYPEYENGRVHGYQVEIDPAARAWTGGIYDEGRRKWLYDLKNNPTAGKAFKQNEWNKFRIVCVGDTLKTWINGVPAANLIDSMTPSGFIALQVHSTRNETPMEVRWRNIRLMPLDMEAVPVIQKEVEQQELSPNAKPAAEAKPEAPAANQ